MIAGLDIIKMYDLGYYLNCLIRYNKGNINPYHNLYHTLTVVKNIYFISKNENISDDKLKLMIIAGIFHDFNHSGGKHPSDKYKVLDAVDSFRQYSIEEEDDEKFIISLITCTEYPYRNNEVDDFQKIIRDADIMQTLEDNFLQQNVIGLNIELKNSNDIDIELLQSNINFMKSVEFFTDYTKNQMKNKLNNKIEECEYLIKILKEYE